MRIFLFLLALACTLLWAGGYVYIHAMACAFTPNASSGGCGVAISSDLRGEDLVFLFLIPGAIVAGLWALFFRAVRRARRG